MAFGAEELSCVMHPKRKADHEISLVLSVELKIRSAIFVVSDLVDDDSASVKPVVTESVFCLETEEVGSALSQAVTDGVTEEEEISKGDGACCGGRVGKVKDPYGNIWLICSPPKKCADVAA